MLQMICPVLQATVFQVRPCFFASQQQPLPLPPQHWRQRSLHRLQPWRLQQPKFAPANHAMFHPLLPIQADALRPARRLQSPALQEGRFQAYAYLWLMPKPLQPIQPLLQQPFPVHRPMPVSPLQHLGRYTLALATHEGLHPCFQVLAHVVQLKHQQHRLVLPSTEFPVHGAACWLQISPWLA